MPIEEDEGLEGDLHEEEKVVHIEESEGLEEGELHEEEVEHIEENEDPEIKEEVKNMLQIPVPTYNE